MMAVLKIHLYMRVGDSGVVQAADASRLGIRGMTGKFYQKFRVAVRDLV